MDMILEHTCISELTNAAGTSLLPKFWMGAKNVEVVEICNPSILLPSQII